MQQHNHTPEKEALYKEEIGMKPMQQHANGDDAQHQMDGMDHSQHQMDTMDHGAMDHSGHGAGGMDHSGHELMFRDRFWVSLLLTIPVFIFSPMNPDVVWLYRAQLYWQHVDHTCARRRHLCLWRATVLQMAQTELRQRKPGHDDANFAGDFGRFCVQHGVGHFQLRRKFFLGIGNAD